MMLYIAANSKAVSVAVIVERKEEGKEYPIQWPVYYVGEVLIESKQGYPHWQKLVYGVFMASHKLKHYFQEHPITVVSSAPLGDIIQNREATGRVAKWAIELAHITLNMCHGRLSNLKLWLTSSMTGLSCRLRRRSRIPLIGQYTLMAPDNWRAQGLEL
jgi:hypothetical protein